MSSSSFLKPIVCKLECTAVLSYRAHDMLRSSLWQIGVDLHRNLDLRAKQSTQMLRYFLDNSCSIANGSRRIERDRAIEALQFWL